MVTYSFPHTQCVDLFELFNCDASHCCQILIICIPFSNDEVAFNGILHFLKTPTRNVKYPKHTSPNKSQRYILGTLGLVTLHTFLILNTFRALFSPRLCREQTPGVEGQKMQQGCCRSLHPTNPQGTKLAKTTHIPDVQSFSTEDRIKRHFLYISQLELPLLRDMPSVDY